MSNDGATSALNELREDARLCKNRHFAAGGRKQRYHIWCGIPVMVMTVLTGTVLVNILNSPAPPAWATITATVLAFFSATLSGLQTFFNFHKSSEGHRSVANRYQEIARRCKHLIQKNSDQEIPHADIWHVIEELRQRYAKINEEAEAFPTSEADFQKATRKLSITPFAMREGAGQAGPGRAAVVSGSEPEPLENLDRASEGRS